MRTGWKRCSPAGGLWALAWMLAAVGTAAAQTAAKPDQVASGFDSAPPSDRIAPAGSTSPGEDDAEAMAAAAKIAAFEASVQPRSGTIILGDGLATLELPETYRYLDPQAADRLLQLWGNPPDPNTQGLLYNTAAGLFGDHAWAVVITYAEDGHVSDQDAGDIDYDELLAQMQKDAAGENEARQEAGYAAVHLIGWAEPPHYDQTTHKLYWAKELAFDDSPGNILNYAIRVLGRKGVLELNAVASMGQLDQIRKSMPEVLSTVSFNPGHRYADFKPGVDKVAAYGIGALIAGKVAAKTGFLKGLFALLVAAKKFLIVLLIAVGVALKTVFSRLRRRRAAGQRRDDDGDDPSEAGHSERR